jgi:hypothetical protein
MPQTFNASSPDWFTFALLAAIFVMFLFLLLRR